MSQDLNQCQFIGRLGRDVEVRYAPSGDAVSNFTLAVGESWKDKTTGEKKEKVEWVRCVAFGKLGEIAEQYLSKGKQCYVSGKMVTRKWTDKDGIGKYTTEVNIDRLQMLGGPDAQEEKPAARVKPQAKPAPKQEPDFDDEPPF